MRRIGSKLTAREQECLTFCTTYIADKGEPPKLVEIGLAMGGISKGNVHGFLTRLESLGHIKRAKNKVRAITITDSASSVVSSPSDDAPGGTAPPPVVAARGNNSSEPVG